MMTKGIGMIVNEGTIKQIALGVAHKYRKRCWWADIDDLVQEASAAVVKAAQTFDPQVGVPFEGYAWKAALFAVRAFLWQNTAPVNETWHRYKTLAGVHRVTLTESLPTGVHTDQLVEEKEWREQVSKRVQEIIAETKNGELAAAIVLEEKRPRDLCDEPGVAYRAASQLRQKLSRDYELYQLWKEL